MRVKKKVMIKLEFNDSERQIFDRLLIDLADQDTRFFQNLTRYNEKTSRIIKDFVKELERLNDE